MEFDPPRVDGPGEIQQALGYAAVNGKVAMQEQHAQGPGSRRRDRSWRFCYGLMIHTSALSRFGKLPRQSSRVSISASTSVWLRQFIFRLKIQSVI